MQFQQIRIEGFGALSQLTLGEFSPGLNVIYGANGSGKTTLLHFIRGVLCGFAEARRLRLLPPLKGGHPGGGITLDAGSGRFDLIRHFRPDHSDTLAINVRRGLPEEAVALRKSVQSINVEALLRVFATNGYDAHDLAELTKHAQQAGIDLSSPAPDVTWIGSRIRDVEQKRQDLLQGTPSRGRIAELEQQRQQLSHNLQAARERQSSQVDQHAQRNGHLRDQLARVQTEVDWLCGELQSVESDLSEVQDRLWSTRQTTIQEVETVERPAMPAPAAAESEWVLTVREIDREIANAQQSLRDLAADRLRWSLTQSSLVDAAASDTTAELQRQRDVLAQVEAQARRLGDTAAQLNQAQQQGLCGCETLGRQLAASQEAILSSVWLICQQLGERQQAEEHARCVERRAEIDRCEAALQQQIQRLKTRRDALTNDPAHALSTRLQLRSQHAAAHCGCAGHEQALRQLAPPTQSTEPRTPQVIVREKIVTVSLARPDDPDQQHFLETRRRQLRAQLLDGLSTLRDIRHQLETADRDSRELAADRSVQSLRYEYSVVEQQLADGREQWQSLSVLQSVLQRTQEKLQQSAASPVVAEASRWLQRMTEGRYQGFRYHEATGELRVVNAAGAELPAETLSRGALEQAALSVRLALCSEHRRRGLQLPLLLDDVLADSDETRLRAAAQALAEFSQHQQVIVFTCQERLATLFESVGAAALELPGARRQRSTPQAAPADTGSAIASLDRIQPDEPYWLEPTSSVNYVPSLGAQMARRLGTLGVRTAGDLIDLDPENTSIPLEGLQISPAALRQWQAEARLLCCVPDLTGRDAQLLTACGVLSPSELAGCDSGDLLTRIERVRSEHEGEFPLTWLQDRPAWPGRVLVEQWIQRGRSARTMRLAREHSSRRRLTVHGSSRISAPHAAFHASGSASVSAAASFRRPLSQADQEDQGPAFQLWRDSNVEDAPSIGPRIGERLRAIGIETISHLLERDAAAIATQLNRRDMPGKVIRSWQQQAELMCCVPNLIGRHSQLLVACGVTEAETIAESSPESLVARIESLADSREGQRLLRGFKTPDLQEAADWIQSARWALARRAA